MQNAKCKMQNAKCIVADRANPTIASEGFIRQPDDKLSFAVKTADRLPVR